VVTVMICLYLVNRVSKIIKKRRHAEGALATAEAVVTP
jgi:hypothetical protein